MRRGLAASLPADPNPAGRSQTQRLHSALCPGTAPMGDIGTSTRTATPVTPPAPNEGNFANIGPHVFFPLSLQIHRERNYKIFCKE